jgi:hypothetical protein
LTEDLVAAADEHDQLRFGERIAGKVVADRHHIGNVLIGPFRHCRAADTGANRDTHVFGITASMGLEHELAIVQHVRVDRGVGRAPGSYAIARKL